MVAANTFMDTVLHQDITRIELVLDELRQRFRVAYMARDYVQCSECFTEDLVYVQPNGKAITRAQLMRDVYKQLKQFKTVDSISEPQTTVVNDDGTVTQLIHQTAMYSVSVFFLFTKRWNMRRIGNYTYRRTPDGWRIARVEVLSETLG